MEYPPVFFYWHEALCISQGIGVPRIIFGRGRKEEIKEELDGRRMYIINSFIIFAFR